MSTGKKKPQDVAQKERPIADGSRLYALHRKIITKWSNKLNVSGAEVVRRALETFDKIHTARKA